MVKSKSRDLDPESARLIAILGDILFDCFKFFVEYSIFFFLCHIDEFFVCHPVLFEILEFLLMLRPLPHQLEYNLDLAKTVIHDQASREDFEQEHAQVIGFNTFIMKIHSLEWLVKSKFYHQNFKSIKSLLIYNCHLCIV